MDWLTRFTRSSLTAGIVAVTVAAWGIVSLFGLQYWAYGFGGFIPLRFEGVEVSGALPAVLTPLSATLLHADIMHIGFNMLLLFYCGIKVEKAIGRARLRDPLCDRRLCRGVRSFPRQQRGRRADDRC